MRGIPMRSNPQAGPDGLTRTVKTKLEQLYGTQFIRRDQVDARCLEFFGELTEEEALRALDEFSASNIQTARNVSAFLMSVLRKHHPSGGADSGSYMDSQPPQQTYSQQQYQPPTATSQSSYVPTAQTSYGGSISSGGYSQRPQTQSQPVASSSYSTSQPSSYGTSSVNYSPVSGSTPQVGYSQPPQQQQVSTYGQAPAPSSQYGQPPPSTSSYGQPVQSSSSSSYSQQAAGISRVYSPTPAVSYSQSSPQMPASTSYGQDPSQSTSSASRGYTQQQSQQPPPTSYSTGYSQQQPVSTSSTSGGGQYAQTSTSGAYPQRSVPGYTQQSVSTSGVSTGGQYSQQPLSTSGVSTGGQYSQQPISTGGGTGGQYGQQPISTGGGAQYAQTSTSSAYPQQSSSSGYAQQPQSSTSGSAYPQQQQQGSVGGGNAYSSQSQPPQSSVQGGGQGQYGRQQQVVASSGAYGQQPPVQKPVTGGQGGYSQPPQQQYSQSVPPQTSSAYSQPVVSKPVVGGGMAGKPQPPAGYGKPMAASTQSGYPQSQPQQQQQQIPPQGSAGVYNPPTSAPVQAVGYQHQQPSTTSYGAPSTGGYVQQQPVSSTHDYVPVQSAGGVYGQPAPQTTSVGGYTSQPVQIQGQGQPVSVGYSQQIPQHQQQPVSSGPISYGGPSYSPTYSQREPSDAPPAGVYRPPPTQSQQPVVYSQSQDGAGPVSTGYGVQPVPTSYVPQQQQQPSSVSYGSQPVQQSGGYTGPLPPTTQQVVVPAYGQQQSTVGGGYSSQPPPSSTTYVPQQAGGASTRGGYGGQGQPSVSGYVQQPPQGSTQGPPVVYSSQPPPSQQQQYAPQQLQQQQSNAPPSETYYAGQRSSTSYPQDNNYRGGAPSGGGSEYPPRQQFSSSGGTGDSRNSDSYNPRSSTGGSGYTPRAERWGNKSPDAPSGRSSTSYSGGPSSSGTSWQQQQQHTSSSSYTYTGPHVPGISDLTPKVQDRLANLFASGMITPRDLDTRTMDSLKTLPESSSIHAIEEFQACDKNKIRKPGPFFQGVIRKHLDTLPEEPHKRGRDYGSSDRGGPPSKQLRTEYGGGSYSGPSGRSSGIRGGVSLPAVFHRNLTDKVYYTLQALVQQGHLLKDEIDDRLGDALANLSEADAVAALDEFSACDMGRVRNKSAYLMGLLKRYKTVVGGGAGAAPGRHKDYRRETNDSRERGGRGGGRPRRERVDSRERSVGLQNKGPSTKDIFGRERTVKRDDSRDRDTRRRSRSRSDGSSRKPWRADDVASTDESKALAEGLGKALAKATAAAEAALAQEKISKPEPNTQIYVAGSKPEVTDAYAREEGEEVEMHDRVKEEPSINGDVVAASGTDVMAITETEGVPEVVSTLSDAPESKVEETHAVSPMEVTESSTAAEPGAISPPPAHVSSMNVDVPAISDAAPYTSNRSPARREPSPVRTVEPQYVIDTSAETPFSADNGMHMTAAYSPTEDTEPAAAYSPTEAEPEVDTFQDADTAYASEKEEGESAPDATE